jgi:MFS family permease
MTGEPHSARSAVALRLLPWLSRARWLASLLVCLDFLDELGGVGFVGAPDLQSTFAIHYRTAALLLFVVPQLTGLLIEPPLFLLADRVRRKWLVIGGMVALGACDLVAGLSTSVWTLAGALAFAWPASNVGINLAQATLMDAHPEERERLMARWTFMGMLGDIGTPVLFAALAALSLGWREAFLVNGFVMLSYAAVLSLFRFPETHAQRDMEEHPPLRAAVAAAIRNRSLRLWLLGVFLCGALDEVLVAFAALHLRERLGAGVGQRSAILIAYMVGMLVGLLVTDRLLSRADPIRLVRLSAGVSGSLLLAWVFAPGLASSAALLALVGLCAAPLYPIAQARAYRALPGASGLVNAAQSLLVPLDLALPLVLGLLADRLGLTAALSVLALLPFGLLVIGLLEPPSPPAKSKV